MRFASSGLRVHGEQTVDPMPRLFSALLLVVVCLLTSCADPMVQQQIDQRRIQIASEPRADYFIARRYYIEHTHLWGYIRKPGQSWDDSRLVVINEKFKNSPDRLPELPADNSPAFGFDHNREYKFWGHFTGQKVYDPNSDMFLPEFMLTKWEVHNESPGWLFHPKEKNDNSHLLRYEPQ
jgi:hypothetical protein